MWEEYAAAGVLDFELIRRMRMPRWCDGLCARQAPLSDGIRRRERDAMLAVRGALRRRPRHRAVARRCHAPQE